MILEHMFSSFADLNVTSKIFIVVTILEAVDVIALTIERIFAQTTFNTVAKIALILCLATTFMLYTAINGVLSENKFELVSYLFATLLISLCTIYAYVFFPNNGTSPQGIVVWIRLVSVCLFCPLNFVIGWLTYKAFGWKIYRKIGANITLQRIYTQYQIFLSLLKIDLLFALGLVLGIGLFQLDNSTAFYIDLAMIPFTIMWAMVGWFGVRNEVRISVGFFLALAIIEPSYVVWKAIGWIHTTPPSVGGVYTFVTICAAAVFSIIIRGCVVAFSILTYTNFGKGLKAVFEKESRISTNTNNDVTQPFLQS